VAIRPRNKMDVTDSSATVPCGARRLGHGARLRRVFPMVPPAGYRRRGGQSTAIRINLSTPSVTNHVSGSSPWVTTVTALRHGRLCVSFFMAHRAVRVSKYPRNEAPTRKRTRTRSRAGGAGVALGSGRASQVENNVPRCAAVPPEFTSTTSSAYPHSLDV